MTHRTDHGTNGRGIAMTSPATPLVPGLLTAGVVPPAGLPLTTPSEEPS
ncbi:hypothetical protein [Kitasatospora sp. NPDC051914]